LERRLLQQLFPRTHRVQPRPCSARITRTFSSGSSIF
jgi:hypothetical protein